jgi:hypothetical protein
VVLCGDRATAACEATWPKQKLTGFDAHPFRKEINLLHGNPLTSILASCLRKKIRRFTPATGLPTITLASALLLSADQVDDFTRRVG